MRPSDPLPTEGIAALALEFVKRVGLIIGAALGVVLVAALALGRFHALGLADLLFWAALVVLGIGVVPALSELGSGVSTLGRSLARGDKSAQATLAERLAQREKWLNASVLFGTAGVLIFAMSFLFAALFPVR
jgi:hypothetical protein